MEKFVVETLKQLAMQSPVLIVYLVGIVLGAALCSRCRAAGVLVLAGLGILLLVTVGWTVGLQYVAASHSRWGWSTGLFSRVLTAGSVLVGFVHASGIGLLLAAAWVGRRTVTESWKTS